MQRLRIQVLLDDTALAPNVRGALEQLEAEVEIQPLLSVEAHRKNKPVDARLVVTRDARFVTGGKSARLNQWFDRDPCATLVLSARPVERGALSDGMETGRAIGYASDLSREDLAGRLTAMCGLRRPMDALRREVEELRRRDEALQKDVRCIADELRLAGTVQRDLLPSALPQVEGVKIHTLYRPAGVVSGDMYDVIRLDDSLVAVSLIDATGHGLAAALLCAYVKRSFGGGGNMDGVGRSLEPDELLTRLNREVLDTQLRECQFIAALYALYDEQTRTVRWSRGGMPYPILVRGREQPRRVPSSGPIIGASPDADFEIVELQLEPGDTLLFHSDGLDSVLVGRSGELGCCDLDRTEWFKALARRPIKQSLADVDYHLSSAERPEWEADDTTIVVLDAAGSKRSVGLDTHAAKQVPALCGSTS